MVCLNTFIQDMELPGANYNKVMAFVGGVVEQLVYTILLEFVESKETEHDGFFLSNSGLILAVGGVVQKVFSTEFTSVEGLIKGISFCNPSLAVYSTSLKKIKDKEDFLRKVYTSLGHKLYRLFKTSGILEG